MTSTNSAYRAQSGKLRGPSGFINSLCFSMDGRYLACASDDHTVTVYDCKNHPKTIWTHKGSTAYTYVIWTHDYILVSARLSFLCPNPYYGTTTCNEISSGHKGWPIIAINMCLKTVMKSVALVSSINRLTKAVIRVFPGS